MEMDSQNENQSARTRRKNGNWAGQKTLQVLAIRKQGEVLRQEKTTIQGAILEPANVIRNKGRVVRKSAKLKCFMRQTSEQIV